MGSTIEKKVNEVNQHRQGKGSKVETISGPAVGRASGNKTAGAMIWSKGKGKIGDRRK